MFGESGEHRQFCYRRHGSTDRADEESLAAVAELAEERGPNLAARRQVSCGRFPGRGVKARLCSQAHCMLFKFRLDSDRVHMEAATLTGS